MINTSAVVLGIGYIVFSTADSFKRCISFISERFIKRRADAKEDL